MNKKLKKIQRTANIGLYGSIGITLVTLALYFFWHYRFYSNETGYRFMLIAGSVLAVLAIVTILFTVRRSIPHIRQSDDLNYKIKKYTEQTKNIYLSTFGIIVIECVLITLAHANTLFMLVIVLVLMLFLLYPNNQKVKVDLGLNDDEMSSLSQS